MNEGIVMEEKQRHSVKVCRHHWIIETPNGATSQGTCKRCGMTKQFPNAPEEALWDSARAAMGRWARRRDSIEPSEISLPEILDGDTF